ncbi:TPA: hypothetical protein ACHKDG_004928, partial [Escherichia coli]
VFLRNRYIFDKQAALSWAVNDFPAGWISLPSPEGKLVYMIFKSAYGCEFNGSMQPYPSVELTAQSGRSIIKMVAHLTPRFLN